jgi:hypothetical protein
MLAQGDIEVNAQMGGIDVETKCFLRNHAGTGAVVAHAEQVGHILVPFCVVSSGQLQMM